VQINTQENFPSGESLGPHPQSLKRRDMHFQRHILGENTQVSFEAVANGSKIYGTI
jgi:hypothetical protein